MDDDNASSSSVEASHSNEIFFHQIIFHEIWTNSKQSSYKGRKRGTRL